MSRKCLCLPLLAAFFIYAAAGYAAFADNDSDTLVEQFKVPPSAAKPRVWWHWIDGNISLEGARLDLAWMQRVGVGGIHVFSGGGFHEPLVVDKPVPFMSDEWKEVFRQSTRIARQAGMEVTIAGSPGWSETGGTWVTPEHAMKKYVWSETQVVGGAPFSGSLAQPPSSTGPFLGVKVVRRAPPPTNLTHDVYVDSAVVAFPTPPADLAVPNATYSSIAGPMDVGPLADNNLANTIALPIAPGQTTAWVQAIFEHPATITAFTLGLNGIADVEVQASDDGQAFRSLLRSPADRSENPSPQQTYTFPPTTARFFRAVLTAPPPPPPLPGIPKIYIRPPVPPKEFNITRLRFAGGGRVNHFESKAGFTASFDFRSAPTTSLPADAVINSADVIDLTGKVSPDGRLVWTPPSGHWTILRLGYSLTGQTNGPAEQAATGLEVDKLDPHMVSEYIEHYLSLYANALRTNPDKTIADNLLTDSWEAGVQNWTPAMLIQFKERRGYDPVPFLPVLAGRVVGAAESSDRFLWDFHRTLKEMLADNHYGVLAKVMHEHGMGYYTEAQGDTPRAIGDGMTMKSRSDIPTAEYWYRPFAAGPGQLSLKADLEEAASAAHVYGKPLAAAESMTVAAGDDPWAFSPAMLKPVADEIFAHGINRILIHESHHQPLIDKKPGLMMAFFGQFFNRNDTWAEESAPWITYLSRTSYMLQQGSYVADVAYFYGEDQNLTELFAHRLNTDVPEGYHYDYVNPEALVTLLSVRNGRLITPGGMSYRLLFLPAHVTRFTLPAIRKIRDLVSGGAVVVGIKPEGGLGLLSKDEEVRALADEVWGIGNGSREGHAYGKGKVYAGQDLRKAFALEHVPPDVEFVKPESDANIMTLHRHGVNAEIYFVSNQRNRPESLDMTFRITDKAPEIWHAETGGMARVSYRSTDGRLTVPMRLKAEEAVFVVFRNTARMPSWTAPSISATSLATLDAGPWTIAFESGRGAPNNATFDRLSSWSDSPDPAIKYFSGTATYNRLLQAPAAWFEPRRPLVLDLGEVHEVAQVSANGRFAGTIWHAPYTVDLSRALHPGSNLLEIKVTNLWTNRLIGDSQPGAAKFAFAPQSPYTPNSPLLASGLLGPVKLFAERPE